MKHMKVTKAATLALSLLLGTSLFSNAQAALVSSDWKVAGDNKATLDTNTGIEWLKLDNIAGKGYTLNNWLSGAYQSLFPGWRLAKTSELSTLMSSYFGNPAVQVGFDQSRATNWFNAFGITDPAGPSRSGSIGYTIADNGWQVYEYGQRWNTGSFQNGLYWNEASSTQLRNATNAYSGFFLVSDGGTTMSSLLDPMRNINNPNAPVNQLPSGSTTITSLTTGTVYANLELAYGGTGSFVGYKYKVNGGAEQTVVGSQLNITGLTAGTQYTIEYAAYNNSGTGTWYSTTAVTQVSAPLMAMSGLMMLMLGLRRKSSVNAR